MSQAVSPASGKPYGLSRVFTFGNIRGPASMLNDSANGVCCPCAGATLSRTGTTSNCVRFTRGCAISLAPSELAWPPDSSSATITARNI